MRIRPEKHVCQPNPSRKTRFSAECVQKIVFSIKIHAENRSVVAVNTPQGPRCPHTPGWFPLVPRAQVPGYMGMPKPCPNYGRIMPTSSLKPP